MNNLQKTLTLKFREITGLDDFTIELVPVCHPLNYAEYLVKTKTIKVYVLNSVGERYSTELIERESLHELAHHLQFYYSNYKVAPGTLHGAVFREEYTQLLNAYYEAVPLSFKNRLIEEGYIYSGKIKWST